MSGGQLATLLTAAATFIAALTGAYHAWQGRKEASSTRRMVSLSNTTPKPPS